MIEIHYGWEEKAYTATVKIIGLGYHKKGTSWGQSDFITIIKEEHKAETDEILGATMLFTSGRWYRQIRWLIKEVINKTKQEATK